MGSMRVLVVRDDLSDLNSPTNPTFIHLLIAFIALLTAALVLVAGLYILRRIRKAREIEEQLVYEEKPVRTHNVRGLSIRTSANRTASIVFQEKQNLIANSSSPPPSPIPEIRITFPEDVDEHGRPHSGRVVVVRVGDHGGVGLEPLPSYQQSTSDRFDSLDLERIGGLQEKPREKRWI